MCSTTPPHNRFPAPESVKVFCYLHVRFTQPLPLLLVHEQRTVVVLGVSEGREVQRHA